MPVTYPCCTADEIALAVVLACRHTGEDPVDCVNPRNTPHPLARIVAMAALRQAFPDFNKSAMARGLGFGKTATAYLTYIHQKIAQLGSAWPVATIEDIVARLWTEATRESLLSPAAAASPPSTDRPSFEPPIPQVMAPAPKPRPRLADEDLPPLPRMRAAVRQSVTAGLMGDPEPQRSALAQRGGA